MPQRPGLGRPLEGVLVADFTRLLPGGFATQTLADLGARVVKVEQPGRGDYSRWIPPMVPSEAGEVGFAFAAVNRGKESVALDLKSPAGREAALALAARAHVVVEAFRPGVMARLGLGYEAVAAENPATVYASLTGYGQEGPLAEAPGHDVNYMALAGALALTGEDRPTVPAVQVADMAGGLATATAVLAALRRAEATGEGAYLDLSLTDAAALFNRPHVERARAAGAPEPRLGEHELAGAMPCYGLYECGDGRWVALGALEPKFWERFCEAVARPEWRDRGHGVGDAEARAEVAALFAKRPTEAWMRELAAAGVPVTPVLHPFEAPEHPQMRERGAGAPWRPGEEAAAGPVPALGEHTERVLSELGLDAAALDGGGA